MAGGQTISAWNDVLADRGPGGESDFYLVKRTVQDRAADIDKIRFQDRQGVHRFRVAEAGIVFYELYPRLRDHEPAVHDAPVIYSRLPVERLRHLAGDREARRHVLFREERKEVVRAGVGAHAACVGAAVAGEAALVI